MVNILDVFSWVSEKELSIEQMKDIFLKLYGGNVIDNYRLVQELPDNADRNIVECKNELETEGKIVAGILQNERVIALIGYKN